MRVYPVPTSTIRCAPPLLTALLALALVGGCGGRAAGPPPATSPPLSRAGGAATGPTDAPTTKPDATIDTKGWWQSMTIWGTLLTAITTVLPLIGVMLGVGITPDIAEEIGQNVVVVIQALGGLIGTLMALFGRARASALLQARSSRAKS